MERDLNYLRAFVSRGSPANAIERNYETLSTGSSCIVASEAPFCCLLGVKMSLHKRQSITQSPERRQKMN